MECSTLTKFRLYPNITVVNTYNLFYVPLTYLKQPLVEIGKQATEALLKCLQEQTPVTVQVNLNAELVVQKSSM